MTADNPGVPAQESPLPSELAVTRDNGLPACVYSWDGVSEDFIINSALSGDERAFEQLFDRHRRKIFHICLQYCRGDRDQAHDLCQETFISAFLHLTKLRDRSRFFYWIAEIARNKCVSFIRKQKTLVKTLEEYQAVNHAMADTEQQWTDSELQLIDQLIHSLQNSQSRETVRLFYIEGKKTADIARIQKITQTAVTTRLNRFRGTFRKQLTQEILKRRTTQ